MGLGFKAFTISAISFTFYTSYGAVGDGALACIAQNAQNELPSEAEQGRGCGANCDRIIGKSGRAVNRNFSQKYGKSKFINVREVLPGLFYRFGASRKRGSNPKLSQREDAKHLCKLGFTHIFRANGRANSTFTCPDGSKIKYLSVTVTSSPRASANSFKKNVLPVIHQCLKAKMNGSQKKCRIATHCTDGMHRAGAVSAMVLKELCGTNSSAAFNYWSKRQVGWGGNYARHRAKYKQRISQYRPKGLPDEISSSLEEIRKSFCPGQRPRQQLACNERPSNRLIEAVAQPERLVPTEAPVSTMVLRNDEHYFHFENPNTRGTN